MNALVSQASPPPAKRYRLPIGFIAVALLMYTIDGAIVRSPKFAERPELLSEAASIDLTLGVTLAYWLLAVRRGFAGMRTLLPVFLVSVIAARFTLPAGHRDAVTYVRYLGIPFEVAIIVVIAIGVRRTRRRLAAAGIEHDVPERIRAVLGGSGMQSRIVEIVATEAAVLFYALAAWRRKPFVPTSARGFSYHKRNALAALLYTVAFASLVETIAMEFVLRALAPHFALPVLIVSAFATVWLIGFARSVQLRPILVSANAMHVHTGVQWSLEIPRAAIAAIEFGRVRAPRKRTPGYLRAALGEPNVLIALTEPLRAHGPYGVTRDVSLVGLVVDDLAGVRAALE